MAERVKRSEVDAPEPEATSVGKMPTRRDQALVRRPVEGRLVCVAGPEVGRVYRLDRLPAEIGRDPDLQIFLEGTDVSRRHARVVADGDGLAIEDLGSTNGTFVNVERITHHRLQPDDHVQIGGSLFSYVQQDELAERVQQIQKLQALSSLAGSLAHDFKNLFTVLQMNVDFLAEAEGAPDPAAVADMRTAIAQGGAIVERLMHFGRTDPAPDATRLDVSAIIEETTAMARRTFPGITLEVEIAGDLAVIGSAGDLHQVLLNLILNARDATADGGRLSIRARELMLSRTEAFALDLPASGHYVELVASDTGTGMDDAVMARIFDPFFTTKPIGKGTGLGLSVVYGIVKQLGGNILVSSSPGQGTSFRVLMTAAPPDDLDAVEVGDRTKDESLVTAAGLPVARPGGAGGTHGRGGR